MLKMADLKQSFTSGALPRMLRYNPYLGYYFRPFLQLPMLLPHDKTYFGFSHLVKPEGGLFLDVGANDGISAMGFHRIAKNYRIFSIEPNAAHDAALGRLKRKIKNFDYRILAAGNDSRGQLEFYTPYYKSIPISTATTSFLHHAKQGMKNQFGCDFKGGRISYQKQTVQVMRLDDLNLQPDIIKVDCEGSEYPVLQGLENTIKTGRPIVVFEFYARYISGEFDFLEQFGYQFFRYDADNDRFEVFERKTHEEWVRVFGETFFNIFCIPAEKIGLLPL